MQNELTYTKNGNIIVIIKISCHLEVSSAGLPSPSPQMQHPFLEIPLKFQSSTPIVQSNFVLPNQKINQYWFLHFLFTHNRTHDNRKTCIQCPWSNISNLPLKWKNYVKKFLFQWSYGSSGRNEPLMQVIPHNPFHPHNTTHATSATAMSKPATLVLSLKNPCSIDFSPNSCTSDWRNNSLFFIHEMPNSSRSFVYNY